MRKHLAPPLALLFACLIVAPALMQGQGQPAGPPGLDANYVPGEVLIQFRVGAPESAKIRARGRVGAVHEELIVPADRRGDRKGDLELAKLPPGLDIAAARRGLEADPAVEFAEPNWTYTHADISNDPYYTNGSLWGMYGPTTSPSNQYGSGAAAAWAAGHTGSTTIYVGIIDEGIQYTHPDLTANVWTNPFDLVDGMDNDGNGYIDDVHGWDFAGKDNTIYDGGKGGNADQHGTHVAGTIGAVGGNARGVAGMNWHVTMISAKFLGKAGGTTANAIKAVDYLADLKTRHGIDLVATNNSWGGGGFSQALLDAINRGWSTAGIVFVAAAGNSGLDIDKTASYPASYSTRTDAVVAVAAIDNKGGLASWSNYGARTVLLGAPGVSIYSTLPVDKYGSYSGTSMATPHVTGALALYAASYPATRDSALVAVLKVAAAPISSLSGKTTTGGRLNASGFY